MSIKFCNECQNIFKIEPIDGILYNICNKCGNKVKSDSFVVSISDKGKLNEFKKNFLRKFDPTLPRTMMDCVKCNEIREIVITKNNYNLQDVYQCVKCDTIWGFLKKKMNIKI